MTYWQFDNALFNDGDSSLRYQNGTLNNFDKKNFPNFAPVETILLLEMRHPTSIAPATPGSEAQGQHPLHAASCVTKWDNSLIYIIFAGVVADAGFIGLQQAWGRPHRPETRRRFRPESGR